VFNSFADDEASPLQEQEVIQVMRGSPRHSSATAIVLSNKMIRHYNAATW